MVFIREKTKETKVLPEEYYVLQYPYVTRSIPGIPAAKEACDLFFGRDPKKITTINYS